MGSVNFALVLHDHQPVGNFDKVFAMACEQAYEPFLAEIERMPDIRLTLHLSGCLMEWFEEHRPDLVDRVAALVERKQVELMGGGFYEPIFTMLPERDRIGQVQLYAEHLEKRFGQKVRGVWVPERVWEQSLAASLADAGAEYTVLDDSHFTNVGVSPQELCGAYVTEDQGRRLRLYPASERLRYFIPYAHPDETLRYLGSFANDAGDALVVYGDDGEKFGVWPRTHKHVYQDGWLRRFLQAIVENRHWVHLLTLSEALDRFPARGRIYLSDASYREMMEWALPAERLTQYEDAVAQLKQSGQYDRTAAFLRGGTWRNFKVKYPEANKMYARMLRVSGRLEQWRRQSPAPAPPKAFAQAQRELYRGQCNCAYWHGVFGGLYLTHLRSAVYQRLIAADQIIEKALHKSRQWAEVSEEDFDLDGRPELLLSTAALRAFVKPHAGGHLYELDVVPKGLDLIDVLSRHREAYHRKVPQARVVSPDDEVKSIHDLVLAKVPGLEQKLHYDWYPHRSFVDHFLAGFVTIEQFERAEYAEIADFVLGDYNWQSPKGALAAKVALSRSGHVWIDQRPFPVRIDKELALAKDRPLLQARYAVTNTSGSTLSVRFGIEFAVGLRSAVSDACWYFRGEPSEKLGSLTAAAEWRELTELGVADRDYGLNLRLRWKAPASVWAVPIQAVSQSEGGFELSHQGSAVMPLWPLELAPGASWTIDIEKTVELL